MASSSSSPSLKHDVFLSFRGEDTRDNIVSHLLSALERTKIPTFSDYEIDRGDEISPALIAAIKVSKISVIIFSKNYADSGWCLDELVKILECRKEQDQIVIPVFYKVDPKDVRKQTREFGAAFNRLLDNISLSKLITKEQEWRNALKEAANLAGTASSSIGSTLSRAEATLLDTIIADVLKRLEMGSINSNDDTGLVGLDSRMEQIISLLSIDSPPSGFRMLGIWGMGGIGKTTIAKALFYKLSSKFEGCCFLDNVSEKTKKKGLPSMRDNLISELLKVEKSACGLPYTRDRLTRTRVLIVLDDVDHSRQLRGLIGASAAAQFGTGSRVIVTTRDKKVLNAHTPADVFNMDILDDDDAFKLFSYHALRENQPMEPYLEFSEKIVEYAKGVPLALTLLGSSLCGETDPDYWAGVYNKLKEVRRNDEISDVLKISYDRLDDEEKNIFLDIACIFKGTRIDTVRNVLGGCYRSVHVGMKDLLDKSLISYRNRLTEEWGDDTSFDEVEMHDLVEEMGWNIVTGESRNAGSRSRLWRPEDVYHVLTRNTGTENVKAILFDPSKVEEMSLAPNTFEKMRNLIFLRIVYSRIDYDYTDDSIDEEELFNRSKIQFQSGLNSLPDGLEYLYWQKYPLEELPPTFNPSNLVELHISHSHLKRLWSGTQDLCKLKVLSLEFCEDLNEIPNLSRAENLEEIQIQYCDSLVEITSSLQNLEKLKQLNVFGSFSLVKIPASIKYGNTLTHLNLGSCWSLIEISTSIETLNNLTHLNLSSIHFMEIPDSVIHLNNLVSLDLSNCPDLIKISSSINHLNKLRHLNLYSCSNLVEISSTIQDLNNLVELDLSFCKKLERLPDGINCISLKLQQSKIIKFPYLTKNIKFLTVNGTLMQKDLPSIASFTQLEILVLWKCTDYQRSPIFLESIKALTPSNCEIRFPN